jgi:DNA-binding IclR family transcriptional regulator
LHSLARRTGLTVRLGILDQGEVVYLDRVTTTRVSLPTRVGGRPPAYCPAIGKVLLAFEDPASQALALAKTVRRTEFTIVEPRAAAAAAGKRTLAKAKRSTPGLSRTVPAFRPCRQPRHGAW